MENFCFCCALQTRVILLNWCAWFLRMKRPGEERIRLACHNKESRRGSGSSVELSVCQGALHSTSGNLLYFGFRGMDGVHYTSSHNSGVLCGRLVGSTEDVLLPGATMPSLGGGSGIGSRVVTGGTSETELSKILEEVRYIAGRFRSQDENESLCNEWKFAAAVIDRLCLMAFSIFTILCTIGILMSAPNFVEAISKDFFYWNGGLLGGVFFINNLLWVLIWLHWLRQAGILKICCVCDHFSANIKSSNFVSFAVFFILS